ncbi:tail fiber domain-containing protein, partial [bacterium]|nr:tail fiber domain-containing protein [bacterium]
ISFQISFSQTLSIQGVLRDNTGASVPDATKNLTFRLYKVETSGAYTKVWDETQAISVVNGVYSATLGAVNSLAGLDYSVSYWLGISVDGAEEMTPRTKLTLSPYAIASVSGVDNVFPQSGNVGIGTVTPGTELDVNGDISLSGNITLATAKRIHGLGRLHIGGEELLYLLNKSGVVIGKEWEGNGNLTVEGNVTALGNVGIGTTDPRSKLMVHNSPAYLSKTLSYNATGTHTYMLMGTNQHQGNIGDRTKFLFDIESTGAGSSNKLHLRSGYVEWSDDDYKIPDASHKTEIMTFDGNGNVGIGTTTPGCELDVNGSARLSGGHLIFNSQHGVINWGNGGNLYFRTNTTTGDISTYDDEAWIEADGEIKATAFIRIPYGKSAKSAVKTYDKGLSEAMQLQPVSFDNSDKSGNPHLGFLADELQKVVPEVVQELEDGRLGVDYGAMSVVTVAAIQEQQQIIESQQKEIDDLKARLARIEASLRKQ